MTIYHDRNIAAGMCRTCGKNPPKPDFIRCESCLAYNRKQQQAYQARKKLGIVGKMGRPKQGLEKDQLKLPGF